MASVSAILRASIAILLARERIVVVNPCFSAPVRELDTGSDRGTIGRSSADRDYRMSTYDKAAVTAAIA